MEEIFTRRSIRKFEDRPVENEKVDRILRAAMQAPSGGNQQPWEFIVVEGRDELNKLSQTTPYTGTVARSAVTLVLLANFRNMRFPKAWHQDMSTASQNILLEATHLGLGAVWMGVANTESAVTYIKELYNIPEYIIPFNLIAIGYPDGQKNRFVDRYKAHKVHYGTYEQKDAD